MEHDTVYVLRPRNRITTIRLIKCESCGKEFQGHSLLKAHIQKSHRDSFVCELCGRDFVSFLTMRCHSRICGVHYDDNRVTKKRRVK